MRILVDECVAAGLVHTLRGIGFDVVSSRHTHPGASDEDVLRLAVEQQRILITNDGDFGDLVVRQRRSTIGLVIVRQRGLLGPDAPQVAATLAGLSGSLSGRITIVDGDKVRQRFLAATDE